MMATFHSHDELVNGEDVIIGSHGGKKGSPQKVANSNKVSNKNLDIKKIHGNNKHILTTNNSDQKPNLEADDSNTRTPIEALETPMP